MKLEKRFNEQSGHWELVTSRTGAVVAECTEEVVADRLVHMSVAATTQDSIHEATVADLTAEKVLSEELRSQRSLAYEKRDELARSIEMMDSRLRTFQDASKRATAMAQRDKNRAEAAEREMAALKNNMNSAIEQAKRDIEQSKMAGSNVEGALKARAAGLEKQLAEVVAAAGVNTTTDLAAWIRKHRTVPEKAVPFLREIKPHGRFDEDGKNYTVLQSGVVSRLISAQRPLADALKSVGIEIEE